MLLPTTDTGLLLMAMAAATAVVSVTAGVDDNAPLGRHNVFILCNINTSCRCALRYAQWATYRCWAFLLKGLTAYCSLTGGV